MLSIFTSQAAMSSTTAMNKANSGLNVAMQRLGTGKRINSAADDAAGLQIATRLQAQSNGMNVAQGNISKATALLQTAEGAFDEMTNIMYRMKDLATQAADDTNNANDRESLQAEFTELNAELNNIMSNTSYGSDKLLSASGGKLASGMQFQIGAGTDEILKVDVSSNLSGISGHLGTLASSSISGSASGANEVLQRVNDALDSVGAMRSALGANINRLGHTAANLANMKDNTDLNIGVIRDADYATEASNMSRQQMLVQTSQSMLKQANGMKGLVMNMLG
ncbi:flagellin [Pantoea sp. B65]|uniref:flagellin N-terminal helical domain-containing protein n=1 Tax=Pantoea sp. B65 TaxID=2813359 RepID=UPI0039B523E9